MKKTYATAHKLGKNCQKYEVYCTKSLFNLIEKPCIPLKKAILYPEHRLYMCRRSFSDVATRDGSF